MKAIKKILIGMIVATAVFGFWAVQIRAQRKIQDLKQ